MSALKKLLSDGNCYKNPFAKIDQNPHKRAWMPFPGVLNRIDTNYIGTTFLMQIWAFQGAS